MENLSHNDQLKVITFECEEAIRVIEGMKKLNHNYNADRAVEMLIRKLSDIKDFVTKYIKHEKHS